MANKRTLKRAINCICEELFAECIAASFYDKRNKEDSEALLSSILNINNEYIQRISHVEPGLKPKVYFRDLIEHFNKQVGEIVDQIANVG